MKEPITNEEYVAKQGQTCPFCGSEDLEGEEINVDGGQAWQEMTCAACGACWTDQYVLTGFNPTWSGEDQ